MPAPKATIPPLTNSLFTETIRDFIEAGQGFAPLVGSGISSPSGILMGQDFTDFLGYTVFRVIYENWDIRRDGWPKYPSKSDVDKAKSELRKTFDNICKRYEVEPFPEQGAMISGFKKQKKPPTGYSSSRSSSKSFKEIHEELRGGLSVPLIPEILRAPDAYELEVRRRELYQQLYKRHPSEDWQPPTLQSPSSIEFVQEKAIRSLYDWRATLAFLASVTTYQFTEKEKRPMLVRPDSSVIDSFNVHITRNKKPNLSHLMIARLVRPLRSRILLTTNFDSLLEDSFTELSDPTQVLEVSTQGHLPAFQTVRAQNSLIKIHGSLSETRADFTLDEPPNDEDKSCFTAYLCGGPRDLHLAAPIPSSEIGLQHLLVMGYSGRDQRTIQLIKYALDTHSDLKVFWICHTNQDAIRVGDTFSEKSYQKDRIVLTVTDRPDLLLYELYQKITHSLPGGGFSFQYSPNMPPEYVPLDSNPVNDQDSPHPELEKILTYVKRCHQSSTHDPYIISSPSGVTTSLSLLFDLVKGGRSTPLWLELEDYCSPLELLFDILQIMALKLGHYQLDHANLLPQQTNGRPLPYDEIGKHVGKLITYFGLTAANWPLFLYGRNGAGGCAGFTPRYWNDSEFKELQDLMAELTKQGFPVIYFPYDHDRKKQDTDLAFGHQAAVKILLQTQPCASEPAKSRDLFNNYRRVHSPSDFIVPVDTISFDTNAGRPKWISPLKPPYSFGGTLKRVIAFGNDIFPEEGTPGTWLYLPRDLNQLHDIDSKIANDDEKTTMTTMVRKLHFLYALTLFRQSRHATAMVSEATYQCPSQFNMQGTDNDKLRYGEVENWVKDLQQAGFLLIKPGGYNWCFRDMRLGLQSLLEELADIPSLPDAKKKYDFIGQTRSRTHFWIGNWYQKTFASTGHYTPLVEALFHQIESARYAPFAKPAFLEWEGEGAIERIERHRRTLLINSLNETVKTLQWGRESLKFWMAGADQRVFNSEFLEDIRKHLTSSECLQQLCSDDAKKPKVIKYIGAGIERLVGEFNSINQSLEGEGGRPRSKVMLPPAAFKERAGIDIKTLEYSSTYLEQIGKYKEFFRHVSMPSGRALDLITLIDDYIDKLPRSIPEVEQANKSLREAVRSWRAEVSEGLDGSSAKEQYGLYALIWGVSEMAYTHVLKAKKTRFEDLLKVGGGGSGSGDTNSLAGEFITIYPTEVPTPEELTVLKHWAAASALFWACLELCRCLDPRFLDQETAIKIRCSTLYGLSLSHLNRFSEAHRRLNEAHALMPAGRQGFRGHEFACLHLRRAEVYLNQAERETSKGEKTWAKFFAHIDDAWVSLERAEKALSGSSHSSTWWGQLYSQKLRVYSLFSNITEQNSPAHLQPLDLASRTMPFRRRIQYDEFVRLTVERVLLTYNGNNYRLCRVCWYYCKIIEAFNTMKIPGLRYKYQPILDAIDLLRRDARYDEFIRQFDANHAEERNLPLQEEN